MVGTRALVVALVAVMGGIGGCAHRDYFDQDALTETQASDGLAQLRVYPEDTIVSVYDVAPGEAGAPEGDAVVHRIKTIVSRKTGGLVLDVDQGDAPSLWVTFDPSCSEVACAYRFAQTSDGRYRLAEAPARDGYAVANFRGREAEDRRMGVGDAGSGSGNDVYLTAEP